MRTFGDLPEHVLHDVVSATIDSTRFKGWQLSLRLVNRKYCQSLRATLTDATSLIQINSMKLCSMYTTYAKDL